MRQKVRENEIDVLSEELGYKPGNDETCVHYWLIEVAQGYKSCGVCKYCGAERGFLNSIPDYTSLKTGSGIFDLPGLKDIAFDEEPEKSEVGVS